MRLTPRWAIIGGGSGYPESEEFEFHPADAHNPSTAVENGEASSFIWDANTSDFDVDDLSPSVPALGASNYMWLQGFAGDRVEWSAQWPVPKLWAQAVALLGVFVNDDGTYLNYNLNALCLAGYLRVVFGATVYDDFEAPASGPTLSIHKTNNYATVAVAKANGHNHTEYNAITTALCAANPGAWDTNGFSMRFCLNGI